MPVFGSQPSVFRGARKSEPYAIDPPAGPGGPGGGVQSVTGSAVDNTDPTNPVVNIPSGGAQGLLSGTTAFVDPVLGNAADSTLGGYGQFAYETVDLAMAEPGADSVFLMNAGRYTMPSDLSKHIGGVAGAWLEVDGNPVVPDFTDVTVGVRIEEDSGDITIGEESTMVCEKDVMTDFFLTNSSGLRLHGSADDVDMENNSFLDASDYVDQVFSDGSFSIFRGFVDSYQGRNGSAAIAYAGAYSADIQESSFDSYGALNNYYGKEDSVGWILGDVSNMDMDGGTSWAYFWVNGNVEYIEGRRFVGTILGNVDEADVWDEAELDIHGDCRTVYVGADSEVTVHGNVRRAYIYGNGKLTCYGDVDQVYVYEAGGNFDIRGQVGYYDIGDLAETTNYAGSVAVYAGDPYLGANSLLFVKGAFSVYNGGATIAAGTEGIIVGGPQTIYGTLSIGGGSGNNIFGSQSIGGDLVIGGGFGSNLISGSQTIHNNIFIGDGSDNIAVGEQIVSADIDIGEDASNTAGSDQIVGTGIIIGAGSTNTVTGDQKAATITIGALATNICNGHQSTRNGITMGDGAENTCSGKLDIYGDLIMAENGDFGAVGFANIRGDIALGDDNTVNLLGGGLILGDIVDNSSVTPSVVNTTNVYLKGTDSASLAVADNPALIT